MIHPARSTAYWFRFRAIWAVASCLWMGFSASRSTAQVPGMVCDTMPGLVQCHCRLSDPSRFALVRERLAQATSAHAPLKALWQNQMAKDWEDSSLESRLCRHQASQGSTTHTWQINVHTSHIDIRLDSAQAALPIVSYQYAIPLRQIGDPLSILERRYDGGRLGSIRRMVGNHYQGESLYFVGERLDAVRMATRDKLHGMQMHNANGQWIYTWVEPSNQSARVLDLNDDHDLRFFQENGAGLYYVLKLHAVALPPDFEYFRHMEALGAPEK